MAIVFPISPSVNDTFTSGSITYKWDGQKWIGLGVTPSDKLIEGSNSLELDANNDLVYTAPGTLKVNSADASGYIAEFNQTNTSNSGQILINSPIDGESRPVLIDMARAGNVQWSLGQGYLDTTDAFNISTTSLASGISGRKLSIAPNGNTTINGGTNTTLTVNSQSSSDNHSIAQFVGNTDGNQASLIVRYYSCGANDGRSGLYWQHENVGNMRMWLGDDLRLRMQGSNPASANTGNAFVQENLATTDNIKMGAGFGIDFSANGNAAGMTSELLNDYEEGTFTPTISFTSGSATVANAVCGYIKVGRLVHVSGRFTLTSVVSPSGELIIGGLPFTADNLAGDGNRAGIQIFFENATTAIGTDIVGLVLDNTTNILVRASGTTGSGNTLAGNVGASTMFLFGGTYRSA